jgi:hypothetical protein
MHDAETSFSINHNYKVLEREATGTDGRKILLDGLNISMDDNNTVKPVLNGLFKTDFVLNGNIFRSRDYHSIH